MMSTLTSYWKMYGSQLNRTCFTYSIDWGQIRIKLTGWRSIITMLIRNIKDIFRTKNRKYAKLLKVNELTTLNVNFTIVSRHRLLAKLWRKWEINKEECILFGIRRKTLFEKLNYTKIKRYLLCMKWTA